MSNDTRSGAKGRAGQARRPQAQARTPKKSGLDGTTLAFIALVIVLVAGSAFFLTSRDGQVEAVQEVAEVTVEGTALQPWVAQGMTTATDPARGTKAPTIAGEDFQGNPVTLPVAGESTILAFMAHHCPFCRAEFPILTDEWTKGEELPEGVNVAIVPTGTSETQANYPPSEWLLGGENPWTETILLDSQGYDAADAFGLSSYPFFVVVGPDGTVLARTSGQLGREQLQTLVAVAAGAADAVDVEQGEGGTQVTDSPTDPASTATNVPTGTPAGTPTDAVE